MITELLVESGIPSSAIFHERRKEITLPGFFRPTKQWDLVVVGQGNLLAAIECKSLCGPSFGNNYNNRVEEALGSATDLWTAYRDGSFDKSPRPFLGYLLLLEQADGSTRPVAVCQDHFPVPQPFRGASYAERCAESVRRLVRERCYDTACLLLSGRQKGIRGEYDEPAPEHSFTRFARLMCNHVVANWNAL